MSQTAERRSALKEASKASLRELSADAQRYRESLARLESLAPESEAYAEAHADVHIRVTVLMAHATTLVELLDAEDDAQPSTDE